MDPIQSLKDDVRKYKDLKDQEARIAMELDVIKTNVMNALTEVKSKELECPGVGSFKIESKRTWKFSSEVDEILKEVEELKASQKAKGLATYTETEYLKFYEEKSK